MGRREKRWTSVKLSGTYCMSNISIIIQAQMGNNLIQVRTQWFQYDGAPPHAARETRRFLNQQFRGRFISFYDNVKWRPYQPDLILPGFFLLFQEQNLQQPLATDLDQLNHNIHREIWNIPQETFPGLTENMATRLQTVIGQRGAYFEHVLLGWSNHNKF